MIKRYMMGLLALCACVCVYAQTDAVENKTVEVTDSVAKEGINLNPTDLFDQYNLGRAYLEGTDGLMQDDAQGLYWIEQSAAQGLADSQLLAGLCRYNGIGCQPDNSEAMRWLQLAAAQDHPYAMYVLGSMCALQESPDWKSAAAWFAKGAELGQPNCMTELAICYINGYGVDLDYRKAASLLEQAVEAEIPDAYFYLGMLYRHGAGVPKDEMKGHLLIEKAASLGQEDAKRLLQ